MDRFKIKKIKWNKIEVQTDHWEESEKQPSDVRPNIPTTDCNVSQRDSLLVVCVSMCLCESPSDVTKGWGEGAVKQSQRWLQTQSEHLLYTHERLCNSSCNQLVVLFFPRLNRMSLPDTDTEQLSSAVKLSISTQRIERGSTACASDRHRVPSLSYNSKTKS